MVKYIYHKPVAYALDVAEVLTEMGDRPHMVLRISIRGGRFPHRGEAEFARIQVRQEGLVIPALYCSIDGDEQGFRAYFATDVPLRGVLVVGYANEAVAEFEFERLQVKPVKLDEARIETDFHRVTLKDPGMFRLPQ